MIKPKANVASKKKTPRRVVMWIGLASLTMLAGLYLLLLVLSPVAGLPPTPGKNWNKPVEEPKLLEDRIYIPRLSLNMKYAAGGENVLNDALWHRFPDRGDPEKGGNFILAGHRFDIGWNPGETVRKSPLYNIDKMQIGDYIFADFNGRRYQYEVTRSYSVKPDQTEVEARSEVPKMTLYTCTLNGDKDGRVVLDAKLVKQFNPNDELTVNARR